MLIIASLLVNLMQAVPDHPKIVPPKSCDAEFQGPLQFEALPDGRHLRLVKPYAFISNDCTIWAVPKDAIVDGASIPGWMWSFVGGPLEGKYRNASVIHDWYCDRRTQSWRAVHRMFFQAMIAAGVSETRAKLMYMAVYLQGPRWDATTQWNNTFATPDTPLPKWLTAAMQRYYMSHPNAELFAANLVQPRKTIERRNRMILPVLSDEIEKKNMDIESIDRMVDEIREPNDYRIQHSDDLGALIGDD